MVLLRELCGKTFPQYEKGKMVWKKASAHPSIQVWTQAVKAMRKELQATGIVTVGAKTQEEMAIYVKLPREVLPTGSPLDGTVPSVTYIG